MIEENDIKKKAEAIIISLKNKGIEFQDGTQEKLEEILKRSEELFSKNYNEN
jgi:hypothetical protein